MSVLWDAGMVEAEVTRLVSETLDVQPPRPEVVLASLGADSLDAVELTMEFELTFGIEISNETFEAAVTVGDCIALVKRKLGVEV